MAKFLSDFEKDQLVEVANIGADHASTALSQMVKKKVNIRVPEAYVDRIEKIIRYMGDPKDLVTAVLLKILGDAPGVMLLIFTPASALNLTSILTKKRKKNPKVLDEIDRSALKELGNILSGASMTALARFLNINLLQSIPDIATDMLGALTDGVVAEIGKESELALILKVNFFVAKENVEANLFFLFNPSSTDKILELTRKKVSTGK